MTVETFITNFAHLADAPNGVRKLRELILQLAVQGNLVPQNMDDEPAYILVERIRECTATTASRGRKTGEIADFDSSKYPYALPKNWVIEPFGEIAQVIRGITFPASEKSKTKSETKVACLRTANVQAEIDWIDLLYIDPKYVKNDDQWVQVGDVIISMANSYELVGKVSLVRNVKEKASFGGFIGAIRSSGMNASFLHLFLSSPYMQIAMRGTSSQTTNIANISLKGIRPIPIGVPPLEEQKRIVAKVDQLMALCNELETRQQKQQQGRVRLNNAALDALLTAREPDEFADHWQRISTNFDLLYDHPKTIAKLRAAILQLAVQGKLVPQDPEDEPASVLLERIQAERKKLVKAGKASKEKQLPPVAAEETAFEVPHGWEVVRFESVCDSRLGKMLDKSKNKGSLYPYLRNTNVQWLKFELDDLKEMRFGDGELDEFEVRYGDLLVCEGGEPGRCAIWLDRENTIFFQKALHRVRPFPGINNWFLLYRLWGSAQSGELANYFTGATIKHLTGKSLGLFPVGLPPHQEQKRIVAKVDQLMAKCDELETKLNQVQQQSGNLMEATVRQLLVA